MPYLWLYADSENKIFVGNLYFEYVTGTPTYSQSTMFIPASMQSFDIRLYYGPNLSLRFYKTSNSDAYLYVPGETYGSNIPYSSSNSGAYYWWVIGVNKNSHSQMLIARPTSADNMKLSGIVDTMGYSYNSVSWGKSLFYTTTPNYYVAKSPTSLTSHIHSSAYNPGYSIIYNTVSNGSFSGPSTAFSGDTVTITITPDSGYTLKNLYVLSGTDSIAVTKVSDTQYTFLMPETEVSVTGDFQRVYTISYGVVPTTAGTINSTITQALPNERVSFRVSPLSGFTISSVSVNNGLTDLDWNASTGIGTFIMPERNTYVTATLVSTTDSNEQGGTSEPGGGDGEFDDNSDNITLPSVPTTGIAYDVPIGQGVGKGIITIYNPTLTQLQDLGQYLYSNSITDAIWAGLRNIFANPMDAIISLHVLPFVPTRGVNTHAIALGPLNTNINSYIVSQQYQDVILGSLRIEPFWGSYLDYSPYTKISLFLPYIGSVELNPDIVMGKLIGIKYRCDVLTGGCVAYLFTYEGEAGSTVESVFGEYSGSMALSLPLAGSDFAQIISGFISAVSSVAIMKGAGTGALVSNANEGVEAARQQLASAHIARGEAYALPKTVRSSNGRFASNSALRNEAINNANSAYESAKEALQLARGQQRGITALAGATHMATVPYTVGRVMGSKMNTTISGTITGGLGLLGTQKPYVIITRPRQSLADDYRHFAGYPSNMTATLNTLSGFTRVEQVELKDIPCTDTELAMLYQALKEGSYL